MKPVAARTYCTAHPTRRDFAHTGMCALCYQRAVDSGKHVPVREKKVSRSFSADGFPRFGTETHCRKGHPRAEHMIYPPSARPYCRACQKERANENTKQDPARCRRGHLRAEHLAITPSGYKYCRACKSESYSRRSRQARDRDAEARRALGVHAVNLAKKLYANDWTTAEIAELLGLSRNAVQKWIGGRAAPTRNAPRTNVWISIMEDALK